MVGLFDNLGGNPNLGKGLVAVLGALLAGKLLSDRIDQPEDGQAVPQQPAPRPAPQQSPTHTSDRDGGLLGGGLGDLLERMRNGGQGEIADSWVKPGENKPIAPQELGSAIGQKTLSQLARESGMSEQELLQQLSKVLPGVVDHLTPDGRVPSNGEVGNNPIWKNPW